MKRAALVILMFAVALTFEGCWYRQCPIKGCKVKYNHSHGKRVVRGRGTLPKPYLFGMPRTKAEKRSQASEKRGKRR